MRNIQKKSRYEEERRRRIYRNRGDIEREIRRRERKREKVIEGRDR
jgi:hypothetical protein